LDKDAQTSPLVPSGFAQILPQIRFPESTQAAALFLQRALASQILFFSFFDSLTGSLLEDANVGITTQNVYCALSFFYPSLSVSGCGSNLYVSNRSTSPWQLDVRCRLRGNIKFFV